MGTLFYMHGHRSSTVFLGVLLTGSRCISQLTASACFSLCTFLSYGIEELDVCTVLLSHRAFFCHKIAVLKPCACSCLRSCIVIISCHYQCACYPVSV